MFLLIFVFYLLANKRNVPQIFIQAIYIVDTGSVDVFVIGAMFFSIISVLFHLIHVVSRKLRSQDLENKEEYYYRAKKHIL